jgi:hypothetical protein
MAFAIGSAREAVRDMSTGLSAPRLRSRNVCRRTCSGRPAREPDRRDRYRGADPGRAGAFFGSDSITEDCGNFSNVDNLPCVDQTILKSFSGSDAYLTPFRVQVGVSGSIGGTAVGSAAADPVIGVANVLIPGTGLSFPDAFHVVLSPGVAQSLSPPSAVPEPGTLALAVPAAIRDRLPAETIALVRSWVETREGCKRDIEFRRREPFVPGHGTSLSDLPATGPAIPIRFPFRPFATTNTVWINGAACRAAHLAVAWRFIVARPDSGEAWPHVSVSKPDTRGDIALCAWARKPTRSQFDDDSSAPGAADAMSQSRNRAIAG